MQIKKDEARKVTKKFKFEPPRQTHHSIYWFYHNGQKILKTRISHGRGAFNATDKFRTQLKLDEDQLRDSITCTFGYKEYVELLTRKGRIQKA